MTESQLAILRGAECTPDTPALPRQDDHHKLVRHGIEKIIEEEKTVGGQLGRPSGARFRTYERLMRYADSVKGTLFESLGLLKAIDEIYRFPLRPTAADTLNRQIRSGIHDEDLAELVIGLRDEDRLVRGPGRRHGQGAANHLLAGTERSVGDVSSRWPCTSSALGNA